MTVDSASRYIPVLDQGLPALPSRITPGQPVPVAVWTGNRFGAVTVVEDCEHDPYCSSDEHYLAMTYTYRRSAQGWEPSRGSGGTDWPGGAATSASLEPREVLMEGGPAGFTPGWMCWKVEGFAGPAARWVELKEGPATTRRPLAASGAFVVVLDGEGPATVRILDDREEAVDTYEF